MRITNSMITKQSIRNINNTKTQTSKLNDQMTSQKKITKPSEDPVIAIRSLRLRNSQAQINQYYKNNIPDATSWLENTETSLKNIKITVSDVYEQCVSGANDTLEAKTRRIILDSLTSLRDDIYSEGNAEYSGRTLFTGYKTGSTLCFMDDSNDTYQITQTFDFEDLDYHRYYADTVDHIPTDLSATDPATGAKLYTGNTQLPETTEVDQYRIRLAYNKVQSDDIVTNATDTDNVTATTSAMTISFGSPVEVSDGAGGTIPVTSLAVTTTTESAWKNAGYTVGADQVLLNTDTGELIFGSDIAKQIQNVKPEISFTYEKTGFKEGEVKPEYYYDCVNMSDGNKKDWVVYEFADQEIKYTIATNTTLTVNVQAHDIYTTDIGRDIDEMINACDAAVKAQEKIDKIQQMIDSVEYANDDDAQAYLAKLMAAAEREQSYINDNMQKLFSSGISNFQTYLQNVTDTITDVGNKGTRLDLVKDRMAATSTDIKTLISSNENEDLSEIVINYTAAYNAYEASLMAASKASDRTLLDYI